MLPVFLMGSLAPFLMTDLGLDAFGLGIVVAMFYGAAALGSALLAKLADQAGVWHIARLSLLVIASAGFSISFLAHHWLIVGALLFAAGMANGCIQPASNVMVSTYIPIRRQGLAFGLKQSAIPLATLIGGVSVPLIGLTVGWRWAFACVGIMAVAIMLMIPRERPNPNDKSDHKTTTPLPRNTLLMLAVMSGFGAGCSNAMAAFLVPSIVNAGHDPAVAGLTLALGSVLAIIVRISMGIVADKFVLPLLSIVAIMFGGGMISYLILANSDGLVMIVLATLLAFGLGWGWSGISILAISRASAGAVGVATGITQSGVYIGAVVGPIMFGWLANNFSYTVAWSVLAVGAVLALALALSSEHRVKRHLEMPVH